MEKRFKVAILRRPCTNFVNGISNANLGKPNYELAVNQHNIYAEALKKCDVDIEVLDAIGEYPDSCFIEDVAICTKDVMMVGNHFFIGISARTNHNGADQLISILKKYGMTGSKVSLKEVLHLKTGLSYIENNNLLISGEFINHPDFKNFNKIIIKPEEAYAANSVWLNGKVLMPKGFDDAKKQVADLGYEVIPLNMSEFRKLDGGLSCLSLRF